MWDVRCKMNKWTEYAYAGYRRNHHTTMKNQNTTVRNTIYHSQRQPCFDDMLFMRRNVPDSMPDVSENASFFQAISQHSLQLNEQDSVYHLTELDCRVAHLVADRRSNLYRVGEVSSEPNPTLAALHTSFNILTFALKPSRCSSFCPSKSSAKRCPLGWRWSSKGEDRPEDGGVTPSIPLRSRKEPFGRILQESQVGHWRGLRPGWPLRHDGW